MNIFDSAIVLLIGAMGIGVVFGNAAGCVAVLIVAPIVVIAMVLGIRDKWRSRDGD